MHLRTGDLVVCDPGALPSLYSDRAAHLGFMKDEDVAVVVGIVAGGNRTAEALLLVSRFQRVCWCPGTSLLMRVNDDL